MNANHEHGGALDVMRRLFPEAPEPWIDLSTGINPWPWPTSGRETEGFQRLPTQSDRVLCTAAMAEAFGLPERAVLVAPGSELLIHLLPTLLHPRRIAILAPTYDDHARTWRSAGIDVTETPDPLAEAGEADAAVICNPNNPDGRRFAPERIEEARQRLAKRDGWLIVDEAFADLEPDLSAAPHVLAGNLLVLRSAGKFYGLPGLRLGALLGPPAFLRWLAAHLGVWSVSTPALAIGAAAYADRAWQAVTRRRLAEARRRLDRVLLERRCRVAGGTDLFGYVEVPDAPAAWHRLSSQGIYVRRFPWTDSHLRIGLPKDAEAEARLGAALKF
ncbi:MAG: threonine-phosphate decarboxylase CobD [Gammaproteobacteria bacterium]|nr:threonine-phosphate decarboxylase CobD [Gammaproteobacteria bacterium]